MMNKKTKQNKNKRKEKKGKRRKEREKPGLALTCENIGLYNVFPYLFIYYFFFFAIFTSFNFQLMRDWEVQLAKPMQ